MVPFKQVVSDDRRAMTALFRNSDTAERALMRRK
jgi:hypothetical protein